MGRWTCRKLRLSYSTCESGQHTSSAAGSGRGAVEKRDDALLEQETSWQAKLHDLGEGLEANLKEQQESAQAEIAQQQIRTNQAEA